MPLVQVIIPLKVVLPDRVPPARTALELIIFPVRVKVPLLNANVPPVSAANKPLPLPPFNAIVPVCASTVPVVVKGEAVMAFVPVPPDLRKVPPLINPEPPHGVEMEPSAARSSKAPGKLLSAP